MKNQIYTLIYLYNFGNRHVQSSKKLDVLIAEFKTYIEEEDEYVSDEFLNSLKDLKDSYKDFGEYDDRSYHFENGDRLVLSCNILL